MRSTFGRSHRRLQWALLFIAINPVLSAAATELKFNAMKVAGGEMVFEMQTAGPSSIKAEDLTTMRLATTARRRFSVYLDTSAIKLQNAGFFTYFFYVQGRQAGPLWEFRVQAIPTGFFTDQEAALEFEVVDGAEADQGSLKVPIHSFSSDDYLRAESSEDVVSVGLTGETTIHINFRNSADLPIVLDKEPEITVDTPARWMNYRVVIRETEIPGHAQRRAMDVTLQPKASAALTASMLPVRSGQPHETLNVKLSYVTQHGGMKRSLPVTLRVRFIPTFWGLALAVLIGTASGILALRLLTTPTAGMRFLPTSFAVLVVAILTEAVGLILVSNNSKFVLLGYDLDPYQLLPAAIIGAFVGLAGFNSAEQLRQWFENRLRPQPHQP